MKPVLLALALSLGLAAPALAATPAAAQPSSQTRPEQASIPFVGFNSIRTYHPVGYDTVYLQDSHRNWYRADLVGSCFNLQNGIRIGVDTRFGDTLDNTSSFIVGHERCPISSLVRSGPPPERNRN